MNKMYKTTKELRKTMTKQLGNQGKGYTPKGWKTRNENNTTGKGKINAKRKLNM